MVHGRRWLFEKARCVDDREMHLFVALAEALKVELEAKGVSTFVCAVPVGESIAKQIIDNLMHCKLAVILGSETYGQQTDSPFSTYDELTALRDHKIPFFLVKTCAEFKEAHAKFHLPPSISYGLSLTPTSYAQAKKEAWGPSPEHHRSAVTFPGTCNALLRFS